MMNVQRALVADITAGLTAAQQAGALAFEEMPRVVVKRADDQEHGDYASPIGLVLGKQLKMPPLQVLEHVVEHMPKKEYVGKIEAVEPGFLNVRLNPGWMTARLDDMLERDLCDDITVGDGKSANIEFISANPTGPMTMGNARTGFTADTLANVLSCAGFAVTREYYVNDAGEQVRRLGDSVLRRIVQAHGEEVDFPADLYQGDYIKEVAATIAERYRENEGRAFTSADLEDESLHQQISQAAVELLQSKNEHTVQEVLGIDMDIYANESSLRQDGSVDAVVKTLRGADLVFEQEEALWLKTTEFGDDKDQVLVKKDGAYTYLTPDIAYNKGKADRGFDLIFTFLGADHLSHPPRVKAAMAALGYDTARWHFPISQMFRLVQDGEPVKLSKRAGAVSTPQDLLEAVPYDAARFLFLMHSLSSHMDFDIAVAQEQSVRNPVYYVQYAYVRLESILRKAKEEGVIDDIGHTIVLTSHAQLTHTAEIALLRELYHFPEVVTSIAEDFEVHKLPYYAHDLARAIHAFYKNVPVLKADDETVVQHRLQLVLATRKVLGRVLDLLGVSKPDVM